MKKKYLLANLELDRVDWGKLREDCKMADNVPFAVKKLLYAENSKEAEEAYWELDNGVVVQGQLFESAEYLIPVLIASLLEDNPKFIRDNILELLFQIVAGEVHEAELFSGGFTNLGDKCRKKAREGLWILYNELLYGNKEAASEILEKIETNKERLETFLQEKNFD